MPSTSYFSASPASASGVRKNGSIMLVDDEPALRTVGRAILSTLDMRVLTASSGEDALAILEDASKDSSLPSLMLLDLTMPGGMSGIETFDKVRELYPSMPVVACSGFFGEGASDLIQHVGFADMLPKPYTPDALISVVRRAMVRVQGDD